MKVEKIIENIDIKNYITSIEIIEDNKIKITYEIPDSVLSGSINVQIKQPEKKVYEHEYIPYPRKKTKVQKDDNSSLSSFDDGNFLINRLPSKVVNDKTINIIHQGKRERLFMQLRCEKVIEKIKKHKYESIFYSSASLSDFLITHGIKRNQLAEKAGKNSKIHVSLKKIYKKVNEKIYRSLYELGNDLRRIWSYFFKQFADVPQLYSIIYTMSEFCEELIKEIDLLPNIKLNQKFCLSLNANKFNPINGIKNNSINQNIVLKRRPLFKTTVVNFPNKFSNNDIQMMYNTKSAKNLNILQNVNYTSS